MARSEEVNSHSLENDDNDRVNITKGELRTLINTAVSKAVKEQFKEVSETLRSIKNSEESKRKREEDNSRGSEKKHKGNPESKKFGSGKGSQQTEEKPKCSTCQKRHFGKCRLETKSQSGPPACGLCKSRDHKTIDCKRIKDATCYGCNEKGHIKTNCPKNARKPEEAKKTNARVFQMNVQEAIQDDNVITG
ncbi:uncharacterized protein LOC110875251 [Helianthus annuus]|uniref:uncharacterized protein LOC110875251 n=1 Tax=Helianthus annuus TaxID=4232 RepID=UPI000B8F1CA1|nr:uncharacterized protein LOC110875251 [Helianthus annuus]